MISCTITGGYAQKGQIPVIAFWGVPDWSITDAAFRTFTECGFTVSLYPYTALGHLVTNSNYTMQAGDILLYRLK